MKILIGIICLFLIGCSFEVELGPEKEFNQDLKMEDQDFRLTLSSFNGEIKSTEGNTAKFNLIAPEKIIDNIELKLTEGTVELKHKPNLNVFGDYEITGEILLPTETDLNIDCLGSCELVIDGMQSELDLLIAGSGDVNAKNSIFSNPNVDIAGDGNVFVDRCKGNFEISISGSGRVDVDRCEIENMKARISGSGKLFILAGEIQNADVVISGSGEVNIPSVDKNLKNEISGSGKINFIGGNELETLDETATQSGCEAITDYNECILADECEIVLDGPLFDGCKDKEETIDDNTTNESNSTN